MTPFDITSTIFRNQYVIHYTNVRFSLKTCSSLSWIVSIYLVCWTCHLHICRGGSRGGGAHPKIGKIWFFGVKSWFFTRNTPTIFAPPSARHNFFKWAPSSLKSWIRPCTCIYWGWWGVMGANQVYILRY